ncbi:molybdate ABC transporter substrate-binding protein [Aquabacterium sp. A7-Y]|uniref:molybdate ABC transporter substrate-binding protein n=1 Tax=Aquabacterium sp. A7-Y TaxID=1349605 RepID=UPI00223E7CD6|nr:molybdate ABC transporter substrate-binding protein [Aquabacterium sp. A7-Y]MCW7541977.1 molybdate ABC transporter substrate-binding protein [Aquabacterium sp. A7-Y]
MTPLFRWIGMLALAHGVAGTAAAAELTVFAAASLTQALQEAGRVFQARGGQAPRFAFAASSTLARQIEAGAQAQLFLSADQAWMDYLAQRRLIEPASRVDLLGNRLVLVTPAERPLRQSLQKGWDPATLLGANGRLATGDPAHVPVGKYAQAALTRLGSWPAVEPRLVRADSVRAALALVERGEVPAGIVYQTDAALSKAVQVAGVFPAESHPPIVYPMALVAGASGPAAAQAREFHAWLRGAQAAEIFKRHGFTVLP